MSNNYPNPFSKKIVIEDATTTLPWHPTRMWGKRPLSYIKYVVIHQSICISSIEAINKYMITPGKQNHISKLGCPHIPYHIIVDEEKIVQANNFTDVTWHTKGYNLISIGICFIGDFSGPTYKGKNKPNEFQKNSLFPLLDFLYKGTFSYLNPRESLYGHCHFDPNNKQNDPGFIINDLLKEYIKL